MHRSAPTARIPTRAGATQPAFNPNLDQVSRSYAMQTIYSLNSTAPDMQAVDVRTPGNQWVHGTVRAINMLAHNGAAQYIVEYINDQGVVTQGPFTRQAIRPRSA
ncbi:hypothetical protein NLI96_g6649 [Meripilus lineatus]|uniref:Uncharacterized protein n=1 Tax=Meripilus lineatus TaxID=2056292 RepID=A0AAD5V2C2_9APHY|nr:hypothetical protein NLI96_g6649 [Physisporinus lineatus]